MRLIAQDERTRLTNAKRLVGSTSCYQVTKGVPVDGADTIFRRLVSRAASKARKSWLWEMDSNGSECEGRTLPVSQAVVQTYFV